MFSCFKDFISRHKRKIIVVGIVFGSVVVGSKFARQRFVEWQEKETREFLERTRKQQYFESSEKTCNQTILCLSATLRENILDLVNCEDVIKNLREGVGNKVYLWKQLTLLVFTKVSLLIYSATLIVIALRIQLNVIGGHIFCKTVLASPSSKVPSDLQEKYLAKCNYFLNKGVKELYPLIEEKVQLTLQDVTLKQNLTLQQVENILWAIQSSINDDPRCPFSNMPQLLFGYKFIEQEDDPFIKEMMLDTVDLLQSAEVFDIASSCVRRGFSNLIDKIAEFFLPQEMFNTAADSLITPSQAKVYSKFTHPNQIQKPLAKIVPIVNGFGNPGTSDLPEEWILPFIYMDKVKVLGANIYESYSCFQN